MNEHEDRILDYALEKHFRGDEGVDLSEEIARAWDEGARGSLRPEDLELEPVDDSWLVLPETAGESEPAEVEERRRSPLLLLPLLAAAVLVAAVLVLRDRASDEVAPPFAVASRDVHVLSGPAGAERRDEALLVGDAVLLVEEGARFTLGTSELAVTPPALLRFDRKGVEPVLDLLVGGLGVTVAEEPVRVQTGFAALVVYPRSEVVVELMRGPSEEGPPAELDTLLAQSLLTAGIEDPRTLRVTVVRGEAMLLRAGGRSDLLDPESGSFVVPSRAGGAVSDRDLERFEALLERLVYDLEIGPTWDRVRSEAFTRNIEALGALLAREQGLRALFRQRVLEERRDGKLPPVFLTTLLDFLELDPDPAAFDLARRLWIEEPAAFFPYHVVAFAERGGFEFERELGAMVEEWNEDPESWEVPPLLPAVHLAFRGDERARPLLTAMLEERPRPGYTKGWVVADHILAAIGLEALGDMGVWEDVVDGLEQDVEVLLAEGEVLEAARVVLTLEAIVQRLRLPGAPDLSGLGLTLRVVPLRAEDLGDPSDILSRLEEARNG